MTNKQKIEALEKGIKSSVTPENLKEKMRTQLAQLKALEKESTSDKKPKFKVGDVVVLKGETTLEKEITSYKQNSKGEFVYKAKYVSKPESTGEWNEEEIEIYVSEKKSKPKKIKPSSATPIKKASKNYYRNKEIKSVTVLENGKKVTYAGKDVLNGANFFKEGGALVSKATYVPIRNIVEVTFEDGSKDKPRNGYHIKNGATPIVGSDYKSPEDLEKELHRLQRELNSKRLSTYREGDNSKEEKDRIEERNQKLKRFNEVLSELKSQNSKFEFGGVVNYEKGKTYPVKKVSVAEGEKIGLDGFPNFHKSGSISGMKKQYYGKDALLIQSGNYIYNVTSEPEIYFRYEHGGSVELPEGSLQHFENYYLEKGGKIEDLQQADNEYLKSVLNSPKGEYAFVEETGISEFTAEIPDEEIVKEFSNEEDAYKFIFKHFDIDFPNIYEEELEPFKDNFVKFKKNGKTYFSQLVSKVNDKWKIKKADGLFSESKFEVISREEYYENELLKIQDLKKELRDEYKKGLYTLEEFKNLNKPLLRKEIILKTSDFKILKNYEREFLKTILNEPKGEDSSVVEFPKGTFIADIPNDDIEKKFSNEEDAYKFIFKHLGIEFPKYKLGGALLSAWKRERKYVNKSEDYEVRYAKGKNRSGYKKYADGGEVGDYAKVPVGYNMTHYGLIKKVITNDVLYPENGYEIAGIGDILHPEQFEVISSAEFNKLKKQGTEVKPNHFLIIEEEKPNKNELFGKVLVKIRVPYNFEKVVKEEFDFTEYLSKTLTKKWFGNGVFGVKIVKSLFEENFNQYVIVEIHIPIGVTQSKGLDKFDFTEFISKTLTKKWFGNGIWGIDIIQTFEKGGVLSKGDEVKHLVSKKHGKVISVKELNGLEDEVVVEFEDGTTETLNSFDVEKVLEIKAKKTYDPSSGLTLEEWKAKHNIQNYGKGGATEKGQGKGAIFAIAKEIRKPGEKWQDAVARAGKLNK